MSTIKTSVKVLKVLDETRYTLNGLKHREDGPAVISRLKHEWWINGELHREDGPARVINGGSVCYYVRGKLHREDGPAIHLSNGLQEWYVNGVRHRQDGPAYIYGNRKEWWKNGKLHRVGGPAIETDIRLDWYEDGVQHCTTGPALVYLLLNKKVWYINGVRYDTEEEFKKVVAMLKKEIVDNLYNTKKVCKDVAKYISCFVY